MIENEDVDMTGTKEPRTSPSRRDEQIRKLLPGKLDPVQVPVPDDDDDDLARQKRRLLLDDVPMAFKKVRCQDNPIGSAHLPMAACMQLLMALARSGST